MYHRLALKRLTAISWVRNQFEIYCIVPSVLLKIKRFKYHAIMVDYPDIQLLLACFQGL